MRDVTAALLGLFGLQRKVDAPPAEPAWVRNNPRYCAGCKRSFSRYVFLENGKEYCVPCARELTWLLGIKPSGQRKDDITLADLDRNLEEEPVGQR